MNSIVCKDCQQGFYWGDYTMHSCSARIELLCKGCQTTLLLEEYKRHNCPKDDWFGFCKWSRKRTEYLREHEIHKRRNAEAQMFLDAHAKDPKWVLEHILRLQD